MKHFVDLCIRPPIGDQKNIEKMASLAYKMGMSLVGLRFTHTAQINEIDYVVKIFRDADLDVAVGIDLLPSSRKQFLSQLTTYRHRFEIITVKSPDLRTLTVAARDSRVDLLSLEHQQTFRAKQSILKMCRTSLELDLSRIFQGSFKISPESLKYLSSEIELATRYNLTVIICSGATKPLGIRAPRDMAALATSLGLEEFSSDSVSKFPLEIIKRNREKLSHRAMSLEFI